LNHYFTTCPRGLETLLAEDLAAAGGKDIKTVPGGVGCNGSLETGYRINLESRIATRVLWRVAHGAYRSEAEIYQLAYDVDWSRLFSVDRSIRVYVTAIRSPLKSLEFTFSSPNNRPRSTSTCPANRSTCAATSWPRSVLR
jgi:putative N6-adenine-specific DNA methylase